MILEDGKKNGVEARKCGVDSGPQSVPGARAGDCSGEGGTLERTARGNPSGGIWNLGDLYRSHQLRRGSIEFAFFGGSGPI